MENLIKQQKAQEIKKIIKHSQGYSSELDLDYSDLVNEWFEKKSHFIKAFNGTRLLSPNRVEVKLDNTSKEKLFYEFLKELKLSFPYFEELKYTYDENTLSLIDYFRINQKSFFDNQVAYGFGKIQAGSKLSRGVKYFSENDTYVRDVQDFISTYIQKNKVEGYLICSVDPVDFLAMSENNSNWRSCHALDGDYRVGSLSYLLDNCTVMFFLVTSLETVSLRNFPLCIKTYDKKWRMLAHYNANSMMLVYNKQYPFFSQELLDSSYELFKNLFPQDALERPQLSGIRQVQTEAHQGDTTVFRLEENYIHINNQLLPASMVFKYKSSTIFADLINSSNYIPFISFSNKYPYPNIKTLSMEIGDEVCCGVHGCTNLVHEDSFLCDDCISTYEEFSKGMFCIDCGERIYPEDDYVETSDGIICQYCAEELERSVSDG